MGVVRGHTQPAALGPAGGTLRLVCVIPERRGPSFVRYIVRLSQVTDETWLNFTQNGRRGALRRQRCHGRVAARSEVLGNESGTVFTGRVPRCIHKPSHVSPACERALKGETLQSEAQLACISFPIFDQHMKICRLRSRARGDPSKRSATRPRSVETFLALHQISSYLTL